MKEEVSIIFRIDDFIPKGKFSSYGNLCKKFSEETSLQSASSDIPLEYWMRKHAEDFLNSPQNCLSAILALSYCRPGWSSNYCLEKLLCHIFSKARTYHFEGKWKIVGEILSTQDFYTLGIIGILKPLLKNMSEDDFFGNLLPQSYKFVEKVLTRRPMYSKYIDWNEIPKRVRLAGIPRKIRKRGYNDKGSRRPNHIVPKGKPLKEETSTKSAEIFSTLKDPPARYWFESLKGRSGRNSTSRKE